MPFPFKADVYSCSLARIRCQSLCYICGISWNHAIRIYDLSKCLYLSAASLCWCLFFSHVNVQGSYVFDTNGKKYLDSLAGLWCTALGAKSFS